LQTPFTRTTGLDLVPLTRACPSAEATHRVIARRGYARYILPNHAQARRTAIEFFSTDPRSRLGLRLHSALAAMPGSEMRCAGPLLEQVLAGAGGGGASWALVNSMPGPWSKATILVMDLRYRPAAVVKVGNTAISGALVENEANWLRDLALHPRLAPAVPRLLGFWKRQSGVWLAQEPLSGSSFSSALGGHHLRFLALLQQELPVSRGFAGSPMETEMQKHLAEVQDRIGPEWRERAGRSLDLIRSLLPADLAMTAAHGDFAAWNLRVSREGVRVFDWEGAQLGYLPLYDLFHFLLMQQAVRGPLTARQARLAVGQAARAAAPGQSRETAAAQCLAYLLALSLKHIHGRSGNITEPVARHCVPAIDAFSEWGRT
jgi:hypothetical protein